MKRIPRLIGVSFGLLFFTFNLAAVMPAQISASSNISIPHLIRISGALKQPDGQPRFGTAGITFSLYAVQEGGNPLWRESQSVEADEQGRYSILLGASEKEGVPLDLFTTETARWLGVQVQGEEEQPRILFVAVPYALKAKDADTVGGRSLSSFVLYDDLPKLQGEVFRSVLAAQQTTSAIGIIGSRTTNNLVGKTGTSISPQSSTGTIGPFNATEGPSNTFYGQGAGAITTGTANSFYGVNAGSYNTTGTDNSFLGHEAGLHNTTGAGNTIFGSSAGQLNTTGHDNSFVGILAGAFNNGGNYNSFLGSQAGGTNTTGAGNAFVGASAGSLNTEGNYNAYFGSSAGFSNIKGNNNVFLGAYAGTSNTIGSNNIFIGNASDGADGITNATVIGYRATVTRSNSLVLGGVNGVNSVTAETNVGIGVTNPDRQLTVEGSQALGRFRRFNDSGRGLGPALLFERARGTQAAALDISAGDVLGKVQFRGRVGGNYPEYGAIAFIATDNIQNGRFAFYDRDIATERVSILNTGNVGIGTTDPTERLHVVGNIRVTGTITYGAPAEALPDYVFEPGYQLMSMKQLRDFLAHEKHLPNIPSAAEIKDKGLNLAEFQMRLLEKTEELTLYTLRQEKTIQAQQTELERKDARISALESQIDSMRRESNARFTALERLMTRLPMQTAARREEK
jgi:hypothetical protein